MKTNLYLFGAIATFAIGLAFVPASDELIEINLVSSTDGNITVCDTIFDPASGYTVFDFLTDKGLDPKHTPIIEEHNYLHNMYEPADDKSDDYSVIEIENESRIGNPVVIQKIVDPKLSMKKQLPEGVLVTIKKLTDYTPSYLTSGGELQPNFNVAIVTRHDFLDGEPGPNDDDMGPLSTNDTTLPIENLHIYPNPTSGDLKVNFSLPQRGQTNLAIYDITGKEVFRTDMGNFQGEFNQALDVSDLSPGTYIVRITQNNLSKTEKLMVN